MSDIRSKNIGAVINNPRGAVKISNYFCDAQPPTLPSSIPPAKAFIGREVELVALHEARQCGKTSFVLHGQGGVGKTELALEFIGQIKSKFEAQVRVDMRGLDKSPLSPRDAMLEIIRAFDPTILANLSEQEIQNAYVQLLSQYKTLVFLDNAKDRSQVEPLNDSNALVVVTSRTSFHVSGDFSKEIEQMQPEDARALLYSVADEERFDGQADSLADLAGYLPMAMLPLASILADDITLDASDLLRNYSDRQNLLRLGDPNRGNLSIEASFDLSYERLSDDLKEHWRKLGVFPSDFDLEAMSALWQKEDCKGIRSELVKSHLLFFDANTKRSRLHDLARDYARKKLSPAELEHGRTFHAAYYGMILSGLERITLENLAVFDLERTNIEKGFSFVYLKLEVNPGFADICILYTGYASDLLFLRMPVDEISEWHRAGFLAYTELGNLKGQAYSLNNLGRVFALTGEFDDAIKYYEKAIEIVHNIGERQFEGNWLGNLANVYMRLKNYEEAIKYNEKAIEVAKVIGDKRIESRHLANLGSVHLALEDYPQAILSFEKALSFDEIDIALKGTALGNYATAYLITGRTEEAKPLMKQSLEILDAVKSPDAEKLRSYWSKLGIKAE